MARGGDMATNVYFHKMRRNFRCWDVLQGHLATECFQIRQKCLKWFSVWMPVWLIWSSPKKLFIRSDISALVLAFSWYLLATPMMGPVESSRTWSSWTLLSSENARGRFVLKPKFSGDFFNSNGKILVTNIEK